MGGGVPELIMNHILQAMGSGEMGSLLLSAEPAQPEVPAASCLGLVYRLWVKGRRPPG